MKKKEIVKKTDDFNNIIRKGKIIKSDYFLIYYLENNEEKPHFGIAVSKKNGNAVVRNKLKRQYRYLIDQNKMLFSNNKNYIIMVKKASLSVPFSILQTNFRETLEKVNNEKDK